MPDGIRDSPRWICGEPGTLMPHTLIEHARDNGTYTYTLHPEVETDDTPVQEFTIHRIPESDRFLVTVNEIDETVYVFVAQPSGEMLIGLFDLMADASTQKLAQELGVTLTKGAEFFHNEIFRSFSTAKGDPKKIRAFFMQLGTQDLDEAVYICSIPLQ